MSRRTFFVDFDGTITKVDTCNAMVKAFAAPGWEELNELWEKKQLSTEACAKETFKLFRADLEDLRRLLETVEIDGRFPAFLEACRERGDRVIVLSDGYDFNISTIFQKHGIDLPFYANRMVYDGGFQIECPYLNPDCGTCGTCKTKLMEELREPGGQIVYIGDGYSDTCPAGQADLVFAKGALYRYCQERGIPAQRFDSFRNIIETLKTTDYSK
ncbi:MAG: MtnX-like HAD-IB family phosphatase [Thermacetogeniaceae bacterium]